ncbi:MAG: Smr/MutS family protein [Bacteroidales bacterium]|nr:Smr/MutS family protein [Bacteroidales bacterium]
MIYPEQFEVKIGFDRIRELVKSHCLFDPGKELVDQMEFMPHHELIDRELNLVEEFRIICRHEDEFPIQHFIDIREALKKAEVEGTYLLTEEVFGLLKSLDSIRAILHFFKSDDQEKYPALEELCEPVKVFPFVHDRIQKILNKHGKIRDNASSTLHQIRRSQQERQGAVSKKLNQILGKAQREGWVDSEAAPTFRNDRPVIPVMAGSKRKMNGLIHDESATGKTVFIEPAEVVELSNEIRELEYAERREIVHILLEFTDDLRPYILDLLSSQEFLSIIDFLRAKALFAIRIGASRPQLKNEQVFDWRDAKHPLLYLAHKTEQKEVVPLSFHLAGQNRILLISGPNAGGKSVCLKTIGLLQYMLQCGLLVPCGEESVFGIFAGIFIDIGDEQSIDNDLSTYSSHLLNMKYFIKHAAVDTLILIDEFGTGTEPMLGGAIAESILERLNQSGTCGIITTHYTNLKHYATSSEGIVNGAMLFDNQKMQPLYQLQVGKPGSSFAFEIARKIGLPEEVLGKASEKVGQDHIDFDKHLREIVRDKKYWEGKRQKIRQSEKKLEELMARYERELQESEKQRKVIVREAREKAEAMLSGANRKIEQTIREIKEADAEKEKTREVRKELETFKEHIEVEKGKEEQRVEKQLKEIRQRGTEMEARRPDLRQNSKKTFSRKKDDQEDPEIRVGDMVRISGQEIPGEVLEIRGKNCVVVFGMLKTRIKLEKLEKIRAEEAGRLRIRDKSKVELGDWDVGTRRVQFRPDIDLRGKRADEAMEIVVDFIDEAIMVSARELRILHGKGNGILRQLIREYLHSVDLVEWYGDEHVDRGGTGITVVRMES